MAQMRNYLPLRPLSASYPKPVAETIVTKRGDIIVLHFAGQMPLAGIAWQAIHYLVGLEQLGYRCWYVEDGGANPFDPRANSVVMECDYNVRCLKQAMERYGFGERWSYWDAIHDVHHGLSRSQVRALYRQADALINLCGATRLRDEHLACPVRIMIDTDPVYEQIKYATGRPSVTRLSRCAYAFLHVRRESRRRGLPGAAVRRSMAPDPASRGPRAVA